MEFIKNYNNNAALVKDLAGKDWVVIGKGIGFGLKKGMTVDESKIERRFLAQDEIKRLLDACADSQSPSLLLIAKICLATGARWSEAENLQGHQLSKYRITYTKTKGKKNRTVPISQNL